MNDWLSVLPGNHWMVLYRKAGTSGGRRGGHQRRGAPPCHHPLHSCLRPSLEAGPGAHREAPDSVRRASAEALLATLPTRATWVVTDGSAEGGVTRVSSGTLITLLSREEQELRVPAAAGRLCSSAHAELCALREALDCVKSQTEDLATGPVMICLDSPAVLALLASGAEAQRTPTDATVWKFLPDPTNRGQDVRLQ